MQRLLRQRLEQAARARAQGQEGEAAALAMAAHHAAACHSLQVRGEALQNELWAQLRSAKKL